MRLTALPIFLLMSFSAGASDNLDFMGDEKQPMKTTVTFDFDRSIPEADRAKIRSICEAKGSNFILPQEMPYRVSKRSTFVTGMSMVFNSDGSVEKSGPTSKSALTIIRK